MDIAGELTKPILKVKLTNLLCSVEDLPPSPDEVIGCYLRAVGARRQHDCIDIGHILMVPWLYRTNEMNDLCSPTKSAKKGLLKIMVEYRVEPNPDIC